MFCEIIEFNKYKNVELGLMHQIILEKSSLNGYITFL